MRSHAALVVAAAALALAGGCLKGGLGHPQLNYRLGHGNAIARPGTSRGVSSSIIYRDHSGLLTRSVLFIPRLLNAPASPWESSCSTNVTGSVTTCVWWLTQDAADKYAVEAEAWRNNLLTGKSSAETSLEVASRALGGDTDGFRLTLDYPLFTEGRVGMKVGAAVSTFTMYDRTTRQLEADADSVHVTEMTGETESSQLALPVTVLVVLPASFIASYRFEWNLLRYGSVDGTGYNPQLSRFGLERMILPIARLGLELQIDGMAARSTTASVESALRSSGSIALLAGLVAAAVVHAHAGTAAAQSGPGPAEDDEDDEDDEPAPPPDEPIGPVDGPDSPVDDESSPTPPPDRERSSPPSPDRPARTGGTMVVIGLELGVGSVIAGGSDVHGAGLGRGFVIGARRGRASIEWHLAGQYDAPVDDQLEAANTAGRLGMSSLGVRIAPSRSFSLYGGMARASVPLLVRGSDFSVNSAHLDGIGPIGGVAITWPKGALRIGVELRLAQLLITDAMPSRVTVTGPPDAAGMIPVTTDRESLKPTIATLNLTINYEE